MVMTIHSAIIDFLEYMEIDKGSSLLTVKNYDHYLQRFAAFARKAEILEPGRIDLDLVHRYRLFLHRLPASPSQGGPDLSKKNIISKSTANYHLIALRAFLKYLSIKGVKTLSPERIELAKTDERQISFLDDEELDSILKQPNLRSLQGKRDKAILDLFFSTGLRVSELCDLKKDDINLEKSEFSVSGKGGKVRVVFLDHEARESIKGYLNIRNDKIPYLFISYGHSLHPSPSSLHPSPITPRSVQRMIRKYAKMAGITKHVSPHTMRHSFATDLLMSGADIRSVQQLLGHSSITTTQIYTHVTDQHLAEVHQAFHGRRRKDE
ncbi:MAG: xerD [Candidatus Berkelbacteria bacterium]|nr:xerD [Candidatus Berkelbacteria bacterium]